jgi:hypothetical protein
VPMIADSHDDFEIPFDNIVVIEFGILPEG